MIICQHCQTSVDDDLIFCTNCGQRLFQPMPEAETVVQPRTEPTNQIKKSSAARVAAIAVAALFLVSVSGVAIFLYLRSQPSPVASNSKSPTPKPSAKKSASTPKPVVNATASTPSPSPERETDIETVMDDRIQIAAGEHYARAFEVTDETMKISGRIKVSGGKVNGFVFPQDAYDEHFLDPTYKTFSFDSEASPEFEQTMVSGDYMLVFVNDTENDIAVEGKVTLRK